MKGIVEQRTTGINRRGGLDLDALGPADDGPTLLRAIRYNPLSSKETGLMDSRPRFREDMLSQE